MIKKKKKRKIPLICQSLLGYTHRAPCTKPAWKLLSTCLVHFPCDSRRFGRWPSPLLTCCPSTLHHHSASPRSKWSCMAEMFGQTCSICIRTLYCTVHHTHWVISFPAVDQVWNPHFSLFISFQRSYLHLSPTILKRYKQLLCGFAFPIFAFPIDFKWVSIKLF